AEGGEKVRKPLSGWHEICAALEVSHKERDKVKNLNKMYGGPMQVKGAGARPFVYADELLAWWNQMYIQFRDHENQSTGVRLSAEDQHDYGRDGTAAPEIGGGVRNRRRGKRT